MSERASKFSKIGIMGGTFDPIHYGHLVAAEGARHHFSLDKVIFVPAARPPHKTDRTISDPGHRLKMTSLAVASNPHFEVSDLEVERQGLSYTIDTVRTVAGTYGGAKIYFITGADAVLEILTWHRVDELLKLAVFIAATRPGYRLEALAGRLKDIIHSVRGCIATMEVPALAISSTDIRRRVNEGRPIKYLLPEPVEEYIISRRLYRYT
ncbi:nicotinate-nucleotide adenylyltransferase [Desulfocucumis palustris]|uniref:Probable nicotinate-nucleotide adenylyltransferase n=1 Tax=Desulfocucumis palustris TaxID=1898651 RepID=A0A2L2X730_9FIRM|nr:nicotinate-nucleotide adenylyltransferase [Desulfocucumis palustris]GBF31965.1 nicotinate-nucleotide adenylyltransferase [Desulfocucumis palustris]